MELKFYLRILLRRWPVVLAPVVLVALVVVYQDAGRATTWSTQVRASVVREPDPPPPDKYTYDGYYNYVSSEFAIDDLVEALRGNVFADAVSDRLVNEGVAISANEVQGDLAVSRMHRIVTMTVSSSEPERAAAIAAAAAAEVEENAFQYISVSSQDGNALVHIIQSPSPPGQNISRERLLMLMELMAALAIGILLAFLVDYLDDALYEGESTATSLRLPHLVDVPAGRR